MSNILETGTTGSANEGTPRLSANNFDAVRAVEMGLVFAFVAGLYIYFGTFEQLWGDWNRQNQDAGYGMVVPFFAATFVFLKWRTLKEIPVKPTFWGLSLIFLGMLMRTGAEFGQVAFIKYLALVLLLAGGAWAVVGHRMFKHLLFPFAFLLLMMPIPAFLYRRMAVPMMGLAAKAGTVIMNVAGIGVTRSGNVLYGPEGLSWNVADACSGMKSLLVLGAVAIAFAYITRRGLICRVVISLSAIPIAIIMNATRVGGVGVLAVYVNPELADGFAHMAQGFLFFLIELALLFAEGAVIAWIIGRPMIELPEEGEPRPDPDPDPEPDGEQKKPVNRGYGRLIAENARKFLAYASRLGRAFLGQLRFEKIRRFVLALPGRVRFALRLLWSDVIVKLSIPAKVLVFVLLGFGVLLHYFHESVLALTKEVELRMPFSNFADDGEARHPYYDPGDPKERFYLPVRKGSEGGLTVSGQGLTIVDMEFADAANGTKWIGFWERVSGIVLKVTDNDDYLNIRYFECGVNDRAEDVPWRNPNVVAYVSYHKSAASGINKGAIHYPDECYPANGYDPIDTNISSFKVEGYCGGEVNVVRYIYRDKKRGSWVMVVYHMNNNGQDIVDRSSGKFLNWWKLVTGERVGFLAQVQLNTAIGEFPIEFDPRQGSDSDPETLELYERKKREAWDRLERFAVLFLEKLGRHLPEPLKD
ncbi:MAG: exosortase/archaeosortase family protein [Planctomycetota bacterium]